jgi:transcriptional regulator with XRE-family HTH domain
MTLGQNITKCRLELGLTIEELKELSQVSLSTLRALESDAIRVPNVMTIQRIAEALGVDKRYLIEPHLKESLTSDEASARREAGPFEHFVVSNLIIAAALFFVWLSATILVRVF